MPTALPESRVAALPETAQGEIALEAADAISVWADRTGALLIGEALAERIGPLGYLAGELSAEVPRLMQRIQAGMSPERPSMRAT